MLKHQVAQVIERVWVLFVASNFVDERVAVLDELPLSIKLVGLDDWLGSRQERDFHMFNLFGEGVASLSGLRGHGRSLLDMNLPRSLRLRDEDVSPSGTRTEHEMHCDLRMDCWVVGLCFWQVRQKKVAVVIACSLQVRSS